MRHLEDLPPVVEKIICGMNIPALPRKIYYPKRISFTYMSSLWSHPLSSSINGVLEHKADLSDFLMASSLLSSIPK